MDTDAVILAPELVLLDVAPAIPSLGRALATIAHHFGGPARAVLGDPRAQTWARGSLCLPWTGKYQQVLREEIRPKTVARTLSIANGAMRWARLFRLQYVRICRTEFAGVSS
jgi:hypothetical protein